MRSAMTNVILAVLIVAAPRWGAAAGNCVDPRLLVLFDSSGSLGSKANAASNYNVAVNAVLSVTAAGEASIEFGMLVFPAPPNAYNCQTTSTLAVPIALNSHAAFETFFEGYGGPKSWSDTPMLQVLKVVADAKAGAGVGALKEAGIPGYVVLLTDGTQDCCFDEYYGTGWGWDTELDCNWGTSWGDPGYWNTAEFAENKADLVTMVANVKNQGIPVFVVGFGKKVDPDALDAMAKAGGTPRAPGCGVGTAAGPCYYQADNATELGSALAAVTAKVGEETCNNLDDDCDGATDEDVTRPCATACGAGVEACDAGVWGPCSAQKPQAEQCNDEDDDCDGKADGYAETCVTKCGVGTRTCAGGAWGACSTEPKTEVCNGDDDDCDGSIDEGCDCVTGTKEACGESKGECEPGERECVGGKWGECAGGTGKAAETCNDEDDDCDGVTDGMTRPCYNACGAGKETCTAGTWAGCDAVQPVDETCNGLDDDCDWKVDDGLTRACSTKCGTGVESCTQGVWAGCTAQAPTAETCDGADNDCDGETDEDDETAIPCQTDCGRGERHCTDATVGPCVVSEPVPETCDGLDNDCNGLVDDGAACAGGGECVCGGCAFPPLDRDGTCTEGVLMGGVCVVDRCPPGKVCVDGECVEGSAAETGAGDAFDFDVKLGEVPGTGVEVAGGGCGCGQDLSPGAGGLDLAGLLAIAAVTALWVARRRTFHR